MDGKRILHLFLKIHESIRALDAALRLQVGEDVELFVVTGVV